MVSHRERTGVMAYTDCYEEWLDQKIQVCDICLRASCWQGIFMCSKSQYAGTIYLTRRELVKLGLESTDYLKTDEELMNE